MEIEAKFIAKSNSALLPYRSYPSLGDFRFGAITRELVRDEYIDTADQAVYRAGYALRIRQIGGQHWITLKARESAAAQYSARQEYQFPVRNPWQVHSWVHATARYHVQQAIGNQPLLSQFILQQERLVRPIQTSSGTAIIALCSLDDVRVIWQQRELDRFAVIELELTQAGNIVQLELLMALFAQDRNLQSVNVGKLGRARRAVQAAQQQAAAA
jgi:inorganic triphosphatase YgiF